MLFYLYFSLSVCVVLKNVGGFLLVYLCGFVKVCQLNKVLFQFNFYQVTHDVILTSPGQAERVLSAMMYLQTDRSSVHRGTDTSSEHRETDRCTDGQVYLTVVLGLQGRCGQLEEGLQ